MPMPDVKDEHGDCKTVYRLKMGLNKTIKNVDLHELLPGVSHLANPGTCKQQQLKDASGGMAYLTQM